MTVRLSRTERLRIESSGRVIPDPWRRYNSHRSFGVINRGDPVPWDKIPHGSKLGEFATHGLLTSKLNNITLSIRKRYVEGIDRRSKASMRHNPTSKTTSTGTSPKRGSLKTMMHRRRDLHRVKAKRELGVRIGIPGHQNRCGMTPENKKEVKGFRG